MRRFAIGDVHGCGKALRSLIETIAPTSNDEMILLGDYVDRGPNSRDCIEQLISLQKTCRTVMLRGNHEIMMMGVTIGGLDPAMWLASGGTSTVSSYGGSLAKVSSRHLEFFQSLRPYYETADAIFVHACYSAELAMIQQDDSVRYWTHLTYPLPGPHISGKRVYVGHTPQMNGCILDIGHLICLDTFCFGGGYLTAIDLESSEVFQTDRHGHLRRTPGRMWIERWQHCRRLIARTFGGGSAITSSSDVAAAEPACKEATTQGAR